MFKDQIPRTAKAAGQKFCMLRAPTYCSRPNERLGEERIFQLTEVRPRDMMMRPQNHHMKLGAASSVRGPARRDLHALLMSLMMPERELEAVWQAACCVGQDGWKVQHMSKREAARWVFKECKVSNETKGAAGTRSVHVALMRPRSGQLKQAPETRSVKRRST